MSNISMFLKSAALTWALMAVVRQGHTQSCPSPYFCSQKSIGSAQKTGYEAFTDGDPGWDGVYHYYLCIHIVDSISLDYSLAYGSGSGGLNSQVTFVTDPFDGSESNDFSGSANESGQSYSTSFSMNGALTGVFYKNGPMDWDQFSPWQTTNNDGGTITVNAGTLFGVYPDQDLEPLWDELKYGTSTTSHSSMTFNLDQEYSYSSGSYYEDQSYTQTATLSTPYTDAILAEAINADAPAFGNNWTDPPTSLTASFSETTNSGITFGSGAKIEYRVAVPASVKGKIYRFKWSETTRNANANVTSKATRTCSVVGTGDPANPALGAIFEVAVPSHPGTVVAEGLTLENDRTSSPPPPSSAPPASPAGAGGR